LPGFCNRKSENLLRRASSHFTCNTFITRSLLLFLRGTQRLHEVLPFGPSKSSPSAVPVLLFFSRLLLVYSSSLYPQGFGPMRVFLLHLVVYILCGQPNAISCLYLLFSRCSCSLRRTWSIQLQFHSLIFCSLP